MNGETRPRVQLLVTHVTLEVFRFLMLQQNLVVVEVTVAVPAPGLLNLLLLASHAVCCVSS